MAIPFRRVLLLRERRGRLPDPIHTSPPSTGAAPLPLSQARQFYRDVLRLRHFVLRVLIVFPSALHRRSAMAHPRDFVLISAARRRMNQVPRICFQWTDPPPPPLS